jgi:N utilization substance protein A
MDLQIKQLVAAMRQIADEKNLPEEMVREIIEQAIAAAYRKDYGDHEQEVQAFLNINSGEVTVKITKTVAELVENEATEISLADAKKIEKSAKIGDEVQIEDHPTSFGRVAAQTAKQVILQRLRESEREIILSEYEDKIGSVLVGTVQRVEARIVRIDLGKASGILPASEQIPGEYYGIGSRLKVYLKDVERGQRGPQLILSRANEQFIEYLFRQEVPEMENGAVEIKAIARSAGVRTKLAVASTVPGVDPVGTFVGGHGTRVQAVMNEIGDQEKIDIIPFSEKPEEFIKSALAPTDVTKITISDGRATVTVPQDQLSIAIGKGGQNVRLASKLSNHEIDIVSATGEAPISAKPEAKPKKNIEDSLLEAVEEQDGESEKE